MKIISEYHTLPLLTSLMSVRVQFEIGHEASVRTKKTPEGFTHDWEVFVRGADNTDIQCFVEKVVFHLHETFTKPRRVIKEPPYVVKESGYAGFVLPIDVYLKNKEEPKKISFQYDLTLQSSGPPISRVLREPRLFQNPSEDFRRKLIRGGGVGVDTPSEIHAEDPKLGPTMPPNKSKPAESPMKKHKPELPLNDSFAELFGTPIRRVPEQKKLPEVKKSEEKKKPIKPYEKEIVKEKEKYSEKERKDRDKSKEKAKRPPSLPPPPAPPSAPTPPPQIIKPKEEHKKHEEKDKKKEEYKRKEEKDKKEKAKEPEKLQEHKKEKKDDYAKKLNSKPPDPKPNYEKHNSEVLDKEKERLEKEKHKHRHKKKEKEKNRDKEKHRKEKDSRESEKDKSGKKRHEEGREKEEKKRKSRSPSPSPVQIKKGPLNALLDELGSSDSASPLSDEESIPPAKPLPKPAKVVPEMKPQPVANVTKPKSTNAVEPERPKVVEDNAKLKKEKSKKKQEEKKKEEHRGRSPSSEREEEEEEEKERKEEKPEKERLEEEKPKSKDKENRKRKREKSEEKHVKPKKEASQSEEVQEEVRRSDKFTKEYVAQLKDLQHRIMTLEDNAELQKVVKVIAETGQYEITKKTFDFDLCALDIETVKRLQEFFAPT